MLDLHVANAAQNTAQLWPQRTCLWMTPEVNINPMTPPTPKFQHGHLQSSTAKRPDHASSVLVVIEFAWVLVCARLGTLKPALKMTAAMMNSGNVTKMADTITAVLPWLNELKTFVSTSYNARNAKSSRGKSIGSVMLVALKMGLCASMISLRKTKDWAFNMHRMM